MSTEVSAKIQVAIWWITSIAVSVLCCSVLFVLFASYLVDVKAAVKDSQTRIATVEERETRILEEIELLRKHVTVQPPLTVQQPETSAAPTAAVPAAPVVAPAVPAVPTPPVAAPAK